MIVGPGATAQHAHALRRYCGAVDNGLVKLKTIKLVFAASLVSTQY